MAMLGESMQAHHDRLALAVADRPQSVTSTGCVDASHDLEIGPCTTQLRLLVVAGFAMTLLSATLALGWWNAFGDYDTTVGYAGVVAFAAMTGRLIWMLPAERGSVATDFDTLLRACRDCHAAGGPRTALQQEDERATQGFAAQAS
jgi:hypothetical protein